MSVWVKPIHLNNKTFTFFWLQWAKKGSQKLQSFLTTDAPPHWIALSFALGTLISLAPTPGLNTILTFMLMGFFRQLPRVGIMAAMAVWNVFVVTPMYALGYHLGGYLFGDTAVPEVTTHVFQRLTSLSREFFLGNLLTAVFVATVCYLLVLSFFGLRRFRAKRAVTLASIES